MIVKNVSEKFGIFLTKIGPYNALDESFGLFGNIKVTVIGKELVIPFIKSVLDALEKGANLANTPKYQIPNTISKSWHNKNELCEKLDKSIKRCPKCGVPVVKS